LLWSVGRFDAAPCARSEQKRAERQTRGTVIAPHENLLRTGALNCSPDPETWDSGFSFEGSQKNL
jgi:hypothetical protein